MTKLVTSVIVVGRSVKNMIGRYTANIAVKKQPERMVPQSPDEPLFAFMIPVEYFFARKATTRGSTSTPIVMTSITAPNTEASDERIFERETPIPSAVYCEAITSYEREPITESLHHGHAAPRETLNVTKPSKIAILGTMAEETVAFMTVLVKPFCNTLFDKYLPVTSLHWC